MCVFICNALDDEVANGDSDDEDGDLVSHQTL